MHLKYKQETVVGLKSNLLKKHFIVRVPAKKRRMRRQDSDLNKKSETKLLSKLIRTWCAKEGRKPMEKQS